MRRTDSLRGSASRLALASIVEYGLQLAIPMLLVRHLDPHTFAQYRLLWLLASTALAIAPAYMPNALFYFLPRTEESKKGRIIGNVLWFLLLTSCLAGLFTLGWNRILPDLAIDLFFQSHGLSSLFLALWVMASVLDVLPTADGRAYWQARATMSLAVLRTLLLAAAAVFSGDLVWVIGAMLLTAAVKITLLAIYIRIHHRQGKLTPRAGEFKTQLLYCLPFAAGSACFLLRLQADQWVVATMLTPTEYAAFSIAALFLPIASMIRLPVNNAMMPRLNAAHERGDTAEIVGLVVKSNGAAATLLIPVVGGLFVLAPQLVELIYTSRYLQAAPVMQVYVAGMLITAFAMGHLLSAFNQGRASLTISVVCLAISIALSIACVRWLGMIGGAIGSVTTLAIGEFFALLVAARTLGVRASQLFAWGALRPSLLAGAVAVSGTLLLDSYLPAPLFLKLVVKGLLYVALFAPIFWLSGGKETVNTLLLKRAR